MNSPQKPRAKVTKRQREQAALALLGSDKPLSISHKTGIPIAYIHLAKKYPDASQNCPGWAVLKILEWHNQKIDEWASQKDEVLQTR